MSKTIESIWKEGFINDEQLAVPKVTDIYNRKSQNIVDKLQKMFSINIKAIIIGSLIMLAMMTLIGAPFLGLYICCLLVPLVVIAKKELLKSFNLSKGQSSYDYIITFNKWLQTSIETYASYYKLFYPLFFIGMATQAVVSDAGAKIIALIMQIFPTTVTFLGLPYYLVAALIALLLVFTKYADALYRLDLNIVYGRQFAKLQDLINDMEELRK